jgi:hypothetical protein
LCTLTNFLSFCTFFQEQERLAFEAAEREAAELKARDDARAKMMRDEEEEAALAARQRALDEETRRYEEEDAAAAAAEA